MFRASGSGHWIRPSRPQALSEHHHPTYRCIPFIPGPECPTTPSHIIPVSLRECKIVCVCVCVCVGGGSMYQLRFDDIAWPLVSAFSDGDSEFRGVLEPFPGAEV